MTIAASRQKVVFERTYRARRGAVGAVDHQGGLRVVVITLDPMHDEEFTCRR